MQRLYLRKDKTKGPGVRSRHKGPVFYKVGWNRQKTCVARRRDGKTNAHGVRTRRRWWTNLNKKEKSGLGALNYATAVGKTLSFAQVSAPVSMSSEIAIDAPEQGYQHSVYLMTQHNALHEHLQAQLQLHLQQGDESPQVEEIAELLHQQTMMSQRAQMEAMAYEQVSETQRRANAEHEVAMRKMPAEANKRFMEASIGMAGGS